MHASIRIGDSVLMLNDEMPEWGTFGAKHFKGSPVTIHLYVENADAVFERAVRAGAKVTMPLADMFWGDRYGKVEDPFGHQWSIGTHVRDVTREEMQKAAFASVRGPFKYGNNHFPIQNFYLQEVMKGADGELALKTTATIVTENQDKFHDRCPMK